MCVDDDDNIISLSVNLQFSDYWLASIDTFSTVPADLTYFS